MLRPYGVKRKGLTYTDVNSNLNEVLTPIRVAIEWWHVIRLHQTEERKEQHLEGLNRSLNWCLCGINGE